MEHIVTLTVAVTAFAPWLEPTEAELDAIEAEAALLAAEVEEERGGSWACRGAGGASAWSRVFSSLPPPPPGR
ncbi:DUF6284 family protein, partial [Saccharomonospora sp. NPDC046836]|uniref:DUF6284 family protein n=1 Tax=Saccharomonospora sp. NPDC046836 TaxID=3156921 RepID=UPI0033F99D50